MALLAKSNNEFGLNLFKDLSQGESKGQNIFLSPFSISTALAMTKLGARGTTDEGMSQAMCWAGQNEADIHQQYKEYISKLLVQGQAKSGGNIQLSTANRIFTEKSFQLLKEFKEKTMDLYLAEPVPSDFINNASGEKDKINSWVSEQTQDKIKDLIGPNVLNSDTRMVLVNAIYFKGKWQDQFKASDTKEQNFKLSPENSKKVPMMTQTSSYSYVKDSDLACTALEMPYRGGELSMVVVLPDDDFGLDALVGKLTLDKLENMLKKMNSGRVMLTMPKFEVKSDFQLKPPLSRLGMEKAFSKDDADFSGMSGALDLVISDVIHQAFLKVAEEGTEAAAATAVVIMAKGMAPHREEPFRITVDHPFVVVIVDHRAKDNHLFLGQICQP